MVVKISNAAEIVRRIGTTHVRTGCCGECIRTGRQTMSWREIDAKGVERSRGRLRRSDCDRILADQIVLGGAKEVKEDSFVALRIDIGITIKIHLKVGVVGERDFDGVRSDAVASDL